MIAQIKFLSSRRRPQCGFSLVELMIGLALGLVILSALVALFVDISRTNQEMAKTNSQIENARFALQILRDDLIHAGYWGGWIPEWDDFSVADVPADTPDSTELGLPCRLFSDFDGSGDGKLNSDDDYVNAVLAMPVLVFNSASAAGCSSLLPNQLSNTDVLVIRHAEACVPGETGCAVLSAGNAYLQVSRCEAEINATTPVPYVLSSNAADFTLRNRNCLTSAPLRRLISHIYYIRDYAVTAGDGIPTLMRSEFRLAGSSVAHQSAQPLIEGIEGFRVELGLDSLSDANGSALTLASYQAAIDWKDKDERIDPKNRGDGAPDGQYVHCGTGCSALQLMSTVAARVYVLSRTDRPTPGYLDSKVYRLGGQVLDPSPDDGFKRHVFSTTVRFVNVSARRETP